MAFSWPRIAKAVFVSLLVIGLGQVITNSISTAYTRVVFHNLGFDGLIYSYSQLQYKLFVYLIDIVFWASFILGGWLFVKLSRARNWWLGIIPGLGWFFLTTAFITFFMAFAPERLLWGQNWNQVVLARREYFDHFFSLSKVFRLCLWGGLSGIGGYLGYKLK